MINNTITHSNNWNADQLNNLRTWEQGTCVSSSFPLAAIYGAQFVSKFLLLLTWCLVWRLTCPVKWAVIESTNHCYFSPWSHFPAVMWPFSTLISSYFRDRTFSSLISFYYRNLRDFLYLDIILLPSCNILLPKCDFFLLDCILGQLVLKFWTWIT